MLIGEFSRQTGLSQDTVRFYVRKGLLTPQIGAKGGSQPWQIFRRQDVALARMIRFAQSLGLSLREIAAIVDELKTDQSGQREMAVLDAQIARLEQKAADLTRLTSYLTAKRNWIAQGRRGEQPSLSDLWHVADASVEKVHPSSETTSPRRASLGSTLTEAGSRASHRD